MSQKKILHILQQVQDGSVSPEEAMLQLKMEPFQDLGFAKVDHHRELRQGTAEVIYGAGKTTEQIIGIAGAMKDHGQETILITRITEETAQDISKVYPVEYNKMEHLGIIGSLPEPDGDGTVVVATGGTSDIPIAEEAAV